MDRFIAKPQLCIFGSSVSLKSNMDRFIESAWTVRIFKNSTLKSNMDRFIDPCNDEISYTDNL